MASICNDPDGRRRISFIDKNRDRKTIWLGKLSKSLANEIKTKVESINAAAIAGFAIDGKIADWLGEIGNDLHTKLAGVGLVPTRQPATPEKATPLGEFLESYIVGRTDIKPRTRINLDAARRRLVEFYGAEKVLKGVTAGDADAWVIWLKDRYAGGTTGRTIKRAKQFFQAAVRQEIITKNPFADAKAPSQVNEARKFFVTREAAGRVLEACPDAEWRLIFALSRFGGLRCPSEHFGLKWVDVDWERDRFRVTSPKTEHLEGGGVRWVPIFPELRPHLNEAFELAPEGSESVFVINRSRDAGQNLRTQLNRIIRRAGLEPWPKLFQNLRATRETELAETYPIHVVCAWIGNTERIAAKHYLLVTEDHFAQAAKTDSAPNIALSPKTSQNTAQHASRTEHAPNEKTPANPGFSSISPAFSEAGHYPHGDSTKSTHPQVLPMTCGIRLSQALQNPAQLALKAA